MRMLLTLALIVTICGCSTPPAPPPGPTPTPPPIPSPFNLVVAEELADAAGYGATAAYLAVKQPTAASAKSLQLVIDTIGKDVQSYPAGGFASMQAKVMAEVDLVVTNPAEQEGAGLFCSAILSGMDALFSLHPEWQTIGTDTSLVIQSFVTGCNDSFATYQAKSLTRIHVHRK